MRQDPELGLVNGFPASLYTQLTKSEHYGSLDPSEYFFPSGWESNYCFKIETTFCWLLESWLVSIVGNSTCTSVCAKTFGCLGWTLTLYRKTPAANNIIAIM